MIADPSKTQATDLDLPLGISETLSPKKFPGRATLRITEVARVLGCDEKHLISLINEGVIGAVEITGQGKLSVRARWKIPVEAYDDFIRRRSNRPGGRK